MITEDPVLVVRRLAEALSERAAAVDMYHRYYEGNFPLPHTPNDDSRIEYRRLLLAARANWCQIVVESTAERIMVDGFRVGADADADEAARNIWSASRMDAGFELLATEAVTSGSASLMVVPTEGLPVLSAESPLETIVEYMPGSTSQRYAALKVWHDKRAGAAFATLMDDTYVYRFYAPVSQWETTVMGTAAWTPRPDVPIAQHGLGDVPLVELRNRPTLAGVGRSEIDSIIPLQDSVNSILFDMMMASHYAAFRQKWVTGLEIPVDPTTGEPVEPFETAVNRLFVAESPDTRFGEFEVSELDNYVKAIEMIVQHVSSISRTPPHYLLGIGVLPNSESLRAAESGLIAKVRRRSLHFGDALEDAMGMALRAAGDSRADAPIETIFKDPEMHSPGVLADSVTKLVAAGVIPRQQAWMDLGYSPLEQERMQGWLEDETLLQAAVAPIPGVS